MLKITALALVVLAAYNVTIGDDSMAMRSMLAGVFILLLHVVKILEDKS